MEESQRPGSARYLNCERERHTRRCMPQVASELRDRSRLLTSTPTSRMM
ncbi:MAG: hypothetical protein AVDCRST_MAG43-1241 [uncultured Thermomicrobiales bacterium]|uniref:Uncharacterized protein n=1 Tax=uncultured Thermomicrobiales bacterium TaxID=1645740 RepID=A0A6J4UNU1_9BACT|nr:MAG: hypothetical protein AVDCRST_MAG43-1241 [uncultured Thermomicrobiales bacterium]